MSALARMARTLRRSLLHAVPMALGVVILDFLLLRLMPGDAADVIAGQSGSATAATMAMLRAEYGLDQPILVQLINYLDHLAHFSLGFSAHYNMGVLPLIMSRLPATLSLMLAALGMALVIGIGFGMIMASFEGRWPDRLLSLLVLLFYATPGFWVGLMAVVLFSVKLGWLPSNGDMTIGAGLTGMGLLVDRARYLVLPSLALSSFFIAIYARLTRASMLEMQRQDFIRTAASKGLHPLVIQLRHVLRNALIPVTTVAGLHFANLLGGAVVVETVYGWPGLGRLALDAVLGRDYNVLLGILLMSSFVVIIANALVDVLQGWLDPRIRRR
ncbi:MAG TPA: ABC transporter permease [Acetobacteraceae bacterium]|jgi:peptide/nickel transport system permease protein